MNWIVIALFAASLWGAWNWWRNERQEHVPPGIVAPEAPRQVALDPPGRVASCTGGHGTGRDSH